MADVERDMAERAKELAGGRPSLIQDIMRGRRTEVQYLNGYVSEQDRQVGIATPFNDKVVELIVRVPPGKLKPDPRNLDPLVAMLPKEETRREPAFEAGGILCAGANVQRPETFGLRQGDLAFVSRNERFTADLDECSRNRPSSVAAISDELLARRRSDVSRPQHLSRPGVEVRPRLGTDRPSGDESRDRTPATRDLQRLTLLDAVQNRANLALQLADGDSFHVVHSA